MNTIVLALWVMVCLLVGTYSISVLKQLILLGPRRVSTAFQWPILNALRLLRQENLMPRGADRFLFRSAPFIALAVISLTAPVIPLGPHLIGFDPSIGLFYFIVLLSPFVVSLMNGGYHDGEQCLRAAPDERKTATGLFLNRAGWLYPGGGCGCRT